MDIDINSIIDSFIKNFVPAEIRERSKLQLKDRKKRTEFTNRLNHQWETILDMSRISKIPSGVTDHEYVINTLTIKDRELWYIISNHDDIDGQITEFSIAFDKVHGRGFGSVIVDLSGNQLYLETELTQGKQNRFVGKMK